MEEASHPLPESDAGVENAPPPESPNPSPSAIEASIWWQAEWAAQEIIQRLQPTVASEQGRMLVVQYLQNLIRNYVNTEVSSSSYPCLALF